MPKFTPQQLDELYHQTLAEFAASPEKWTSFLDTAARLYKYDFKSQVLIWSQRPDATACAELPLWNDRLHRRVNRGSNGIGIVDNSSNQPRIKYLFDISDTSPRDQSVAPPYIWQMRNDAYDTVLDGISAALGENMQTDFDFPINLYLSAQCFADKKASEYTDNTDLIRIAVKSTAYCVLRRCGFDPAQYSSDISTGNLSPDELALVGQITQEASETALRSIEQSMKNLDGCKLFRFTTRKRIAEQPSMLYNKGTERVSEPTKEGAVIDGKTAEESILPRGTGRQDAPRSGKAGVRRMGRSASEVHEAVPAGGTDGVASELRAEPLSEQAGSPRDGQIRVAGSTESEASWRDRGTERTRPDAVDRSDGQHSARSDADHRGNLHLLNSQTAAEPEKPAAVAFEQMSLTDDGGNVFEPNTQPAAPASDVFDWNTPDVSDEVINRVLTAGSNSTHSRERIAAFFMQPNISIADAAAFLRREYRVGGAGVRVHNIDHSLWFDSNGLRIARGHDTRTPRAAVLTYEDAANRISTLLKNGQYASAAELTDAKPNEYRELASEIWHTYHDMSEEAREQGFFAQTKEFANDVFPPAVEKLTAALSDPAQRTVLTGEMTDYARAVQQNSNLCRFCFNVQRSEDAAERLQRTEHMTALYAAADGFEPVRAAFITQDEIDEMLRSGSGIEHGKKRISEFYAENHTQKERIEFLKNEYGWGGRAYGGYSENHDGKGIAFERSIDRKVYDRITLSWSQVDHQISTLIRQNRYLTPEEQRRYAQERTDTVTISEPENVFQSNTPADNSIMVRCEWSESSAFEDGKVYPLAEFDRLMRKADEDFVSGRENIEQKYGSLENAFDAGYEEAYQYAGYSKTKFTLLLPDGRTFTERQDIGDGDGGLLDFLSQYPAYNDIMPMLREAAGSMPEPENVFHWNTQDYHAGDTVYLDGRPFEITEIGKLNIQLRDPAQPYPIFRSENRESLARLMAQDERNAAPDVFQSNTQETAQTDSAQPVSIMIDGKWTEFPSVQEAEKASLEEYRNALRRNPPTFHITDDNLGIGTLGEKFDRNLAAVRLLKSLEAADRPATAEEQQVLSQYVGWGGMASAFSPNNRRYEQLRSLLTEDEYKAARASVLNAHYTSPVIIKAMYTALGQMGFEGGKVLEPSMGVGNFFGMLPESMVSSQLTGVELDSISGRIARKLYPNADIKITGYENTKFADNSFDVAIGNVPFGDYSLHDKRYDKDHLLIHDYFFVKTLDKVRPGGIVAFVTSKGTLDKANPAARRLMAERADLLGAIRLPNTAFKANAGASVTTDILFLQKRDTPPEQLPAWTETGKNADGMELNNYFLQHPEMILGTMQEVTTQHGKDTACVPDPNVELEDLLSAAVLHLGHENVFQSNTLIEDDVFQSNTQEPPAPETADVFQSNTPMAALRPFSYAVQDGKLMFKEADGNLVPSEMNATAVKRAISMIGIRDAVRNLIEAQRDGCDDEQLHALQADLTQNYDTFVKEFGNIHKRGNKLAFRKDAGYPLLLALEKLDDEQNVIGKTAIFSKRTISPHIVATHADTPEDALGLSLAERGKIDFAYMSALLDGMPQEQITSSLRQQIFLDPQTQEWQPADEYLSGNVRAKLDIARLAAQSDPDFAVNVQMLERVQPEPLTAADINVKLGTTWIPPEDIDHFIRDVLHPPFYALNKIKTSYSDAAKLWYVSNKSVDKDPHSLAYTKYGTSRVNAYELLELSLNLRDVQVSDVKIIDGKEKRIPNTKETIKARNAQDALRQAFKDWVFDDPARRERLVGYYNEHFNTTRPREFDGSHLTLPGINPSIQLYSHQKDAVARILYGGNALLAHCVGAGKTWTMAAAAMELRRLGLSHKPMFVVPNSLTEQWGTEFQQLYPGANILVATEADFTKENRKAFCARIATGDYDAVIIGHTQFEKIPLSPENERRHIERQLDTLELSLTDAKRNKDLNFTVKRLESSKKKLETRLEKLMDAKEKDDVVTFEELGVDRLFVDEADEFKNLALFTKMRNVGGINTSAAQKSEDMLAKCEYLNEKTDYHGVCFATGTPVSNSMTELYTMMRYLQNDTLESVNMADFDSWASNFGETVTAMELAPEGYTLVGR